MVGLPYPNLKSPELKEKMDYLNANMVSAAPLTDCGFEVIIIMIRLANYHLSEIVL